MASTFGPRVPWVRGLPPGIHDWTADKDTWELYHLGEDWSQASDLAAEMPGKFAELKELFLIEATKVGAFPIGGGLWIPMLDPELRPAPPYTEWTFFGDTVRVPEFSAPALGTRPNVVAIDQDKVKYHVRTPSSPRWKAPRYWLAPGLDSAGQSPGPLACASDLQTPSRASSRPDRTAATKSW
ncbi:MAG: hypothetical protein WA895_12300 [Streptosporangiaceae bacterium]